MKHSRQRIPPLKGLPAKEWISYFWLGWFIDSRMRWTVWSFVFKVKCRLLAVENLGAKCFGNVDLYKAPLSRITIGEGVSITSSSMRGNASSLYAKARIRTYTPTASIKVGARTGMNGISLTARSRGITIGENCRIAPNVVIVDSDYHGVLPANLRADNPGFEYDADVEIEDNVWIGMQSIILKGVTIGHNSVIAAGSVVVNDIPANCIAAGVPAKPVKFIEGRGE